MVSFFNESSKSKGFSSSPINAFSSGNRVKSVFENLRYVVMELFSFGESGDFGSDVLKTFEIDSSVSDEAVLGGVLDLLPLFVTPVFSVEGDALGLSVSLF